MDIPHAPATLAGGVAVFDYNLDGRPDIFLTNGANIATLKTDMPKYSSRLFRNDGNGVFTDATERAGLAGIGYDNGVAVGDYDNDGYPDLFVTGVHGRTLYHNNGDGTFSDVTVKSHLDRWNDPDFVPFDTAQSLRRSDRVKPGRQRIGSSGYYFRMRFEKLSVFANCQHSVAPLQSAVCFLGQCLSIRFPQFLPADQR